MNIDFYRIKKISLGAGAYLKNHPAGSLLLIVFLLTIYALLIFGAYAVSGPAQTPISSNLRIDPNLYQKVLENLKEREANIQRGIGQEYPDIFR